MVAAARLAKPTNLCFAEASGNGRFAAWPWAARIRNPELLLLKTASTPEKTRRFAGPCCVQYSCGVMRYATRVPEPAVCLLRVNAGVDAVRS